jgi:hypothetical protein
MRYRIALPTWLALKLGLKHFRPDHPWLQRPRFFTLQEWHAGRTRICREYDYAVWWAVLLLTIVLARTVYLIWRG